MQTPVKSVCMATIFYNYIIIPNCCQENRERRTIGSKKLLCPNIFLPLFYHRKYKETTHPENGVLCIYIVTLLVPKKHCGTTTFRCENCCPCILCPTPKKAEVRALHFHPKPAAISKLPYPQGHPKFENTSVCRGLGQNIGKLNT